MRPLLASYLTLFSSTSHSTSSPSSNYPRLLATPGTHQSVFLWPEHSSPTVIQAQSLIFFSLGTQGSY